MIPGRETEKIALACTRLEHNIRNLIVALGGRVAYDSTRYLRRNISRVLAQSPEEELDFHIVQLQRLARLLLFPALHYDTGAFPDHFFNDNPGDHEYRSAFAYYFQSKKTAASIFGSISILGIY